MPLREISVRILCSWEKKVATEGFHGNRKKKTAGKSKPQANGEHRQGKSQAKQRSRHETRNSNKQQQTILFWWRNSASCEGHHWAIRIRRRERRGWEWKGLYLRWQETHDESPGERRCGPEIRKGSDLKEPEATDPRCSQPGGSRLIHNITGRNSWNKTSNKCHGKNISNSSAPNTGRC